MTPIPFSIELWQQGYRPVTMNPAIEVTDLRHHDEVVWVWRENGRKHYCGYGFISQYMLLLPPEDESNEIVVEVKELIEGLTAVSENFQKSKVPPGKYILKPVKNN